MRHRLQMEVTTGCMRRRGSATGWALLAFLLFSISLGAGERRAPDPLAKVIRLDLWGKTLSDAVSRVTEQSGIDLRVSPHFIRPREFANHTLYIRSDRISTRLAVEWIARQLGCRYRMDSPRSVWLTGSYDWLNQDDDRTVLIESVDPVLGGGNDFPGLMRKLDEVAKVASLFPEYSIRVEREDRNLVAILPARLKTVLKNALLVMEKPGLSLEKPVSVSLEAAETELHKLLRRTVVARCNGWSVREVIDDLQLQTGVNISFDPRPFLKKPLPKITFNLQPDATLRQAVESLAKQMGFQGYELSPPGGVFLTSQPRTWTLAASREFFWDRLEVKAYAIGDLVEQSGGKAIAHHIRRRVDPDAWLDPSASVVYHEVQQSLIVVAPPSTQRQVYAELHTLWIRTDPSSGKKRVSSPLAP